MNNMTACKDCVYYSKKHEEHNNGLCRIYPPAILNLKNSNIGIWPAVSDQDWCGEFKKKVEPEDILSNYPAIKRYLITFYENQEAKESNTTTSKHVCGIDVNDAMNFLRRSHPFCIVINGRED